MLLFQAEDGIRDYKVTGVRTCALPIFRKERSFGLEECRPSYVLPYDLRWPALFETERALLANALRPWLRGPIEHVGSTAVTGMPAKPVIDIMAGVESLEASRSALDVLGEFGYVYAPYRTDVMH